MLKSLNHITIAAKSLDESFHFYIEILGMKSHAEWAKGAYLSLENLWFCLSLDESAPTNDYIHIVFDIEGENFMSIRDRLDSLNVRAWKQNNSKGDSIYFLDPDGHKLEVHVGSLNARLESLKLEPYEGLQFLVLWDLMWLTLEIKLAVSRIAEFETANQYKFDPPHFEYLSTT